MFLDNPIKQQPESRRGAPARRRQRTRKYLFPSAFQVTGLKYINYSIPAMYKYKISFYLAYFIPWQLESTISNRDLRCITCLWSAKACSWFVKELYIFQIISKYFLDNIQIFSLHIMMSSAVLAHCNSSPPCLGQSLTVTIINCNRHGSGPINK